MSESLEKAFIKPIIQTWLKSMDCTSDSSDSNCMFILEYDYDHKDENGCCKTRLGMIQFYDRSLKKKLQGGFYGDIMELSIYDVMLNPEEQVNSVDDCLKDVNAEPAYYLHFEMHDFEFVLEQLNSFFSFLYQVGEEENTTEECPEKIENILICCTCGLTSGYYASLLKKKLDQCVPDNTIHTQGANVNLLPTMIDNFDIVFLAPQVYYMENELRQMYGDKVQLVDRVDFATFKFDGILNKLDYTLKNQHTHLQESNEVYLPSFSQNGLYA